MKSVFVYLLLCALCVDDIYIDAFIDQLMEKLPCSFYRLNKHQHGRQEPLKHGKKDISFIKISRNGFIHVFFFAFTIPNAHIK